MTNLGKTSNELTAEFAELRVGFSAISAVKEFVRGIT